MGKKWRPPLPPVVGEATEFRSAIADILDNATLAELLAQYRAFKDRPDDAKPSPEEIGIHRALVKGFRWIVYGGTQSKYGYCYSQWGSLYCGLAGAIARLRANNIASEGVEK